MEVHPPLRMVIFSIQDLHNAMKTASEDVALTPH